MDGKQAYRGITGPWANIVGRLWMELSMSVSAMRLAFGGCWLRPSSTGGPATRPCSVAGARISVPPRSRFRQPAGGA